MKMTVTIRYTDGDTEIYRDVKDVTTKEGMWVIAMENRNLMLNRDVLTSIDVVREENTNEG